MLISLLNNHLIRPVEPHLDMYQVILIVYAGISTDVYVSAGSVVLGSGVSKVVMKAHIPIPVSGKKIVIDASNFAIPTVLDNLIDIFIPSSWNVPSLPGTSSKYTK